MIPLLALACRAKDDADTGPIDADGDGVYAGLDCDDDNDAVSNQESSNEDIGVATFEVWVR